MFVVAFILYIVWSTGLHADDYHLIEQMRLWTLNNYLFPDPKEINVLIFGPVSYYFGYLSFFVFGSDYLWGYDVVKAISSLVSILLIQRFAADYLTSNRAWLAALIYVLLPNHDTTLYWVLTLIYIITPACIMFSHHLVRNEKYGLGFIIGLIGSFASHASPPFTFGLALIFLVERSYKKAALFITPGILYLVYYFLIYRIPGVSARRINSELTLTSFVSNFLVQIASFLDAAIGPSFWLKIWYSISSISSISIIITIFSLLTILKIDFSQNGRVSRPLIAGLCAVTILGLAMFSLTGVYPQIAFNLGNRIMVYGTLLIAFLIAMLPIGRFYMLGIMAVLISAVLGLSDHWKTWNRSQIEVIENIRTLTPEFEKIPTGAILFVTGHPYSQLGQLGHIEFFSETSGVWGVFSYALGAKQKFGIHSLNKWHFIKENNLIDIKYNKTMSLGNEVWVYNSESNTLMKSDINDLNGIIKSIPDSPRHWLQMGDENPLRSVALKMIPRLEYAFK